MKIRTFAWITLLGVFSGYAFGEDVPFRQVVIDPAFRCDAKALGDLDGDGLPDVVLGSGNELVWYRAPGWSKILIASGGDFGTDIRLGDVDHDGDLDIISPDGLAKKDNVLWLENPRPGGNPGTASWKKHYIGAFQGIGAPQAHDIEVGDIDGDGRLDVATRRVRTTVWLQRGADTWTKVDLPGAVPGREGITLADLDDDGDLDLVLNGYWMETPENPADGAAWAKHEIDPNWPRDAGVAIADFNKDGRPDVILVRSESKGGRLSWFETANPRKGPWIEHVIDADVDHVHSLQAADIDQDGDTDVIFAEMAQSPRKRVGFFRNGGNGLEWSLQVLATTGSHNAKAGDIGGDGDIDIVGVNWQSPGVMLWQNLSSKRPVPLKRKASSHTYIQIEDQKGKYGAWASPGNMKYFGLAAGNITSKRSRDVVAGRYFYRNPGGDMANGGVNWRRTDLGYNVDANVIMDVDGDSFGDVLAQAGENADVKDRSNTLEIWWFEATDPDGTRFMKQNGGRPVGRTPRSGYHVITHGFGAAQIEKGGKPEVYVASPAGVWYFKVPGDPNRAPQDWEHVKVTPEGYNSCEAVADIDGDGHNDIVGIAADSKDETGIVWWRNPGRPGEGNWRRFGVGSLNIERGAIALSDFDGDGRPDVVAAEETGTAATRQGSIYWFKNPGTLTGTRPWQRKYIAGKYFSIQSLRAADLDRDGDIDFVAGEHRHRAKVGFDELGLYLFENDGHARFTRKEIARGYDHHDGCKLVDLDGDGDIDILSTGWDGDHWRYLRLWRNDAVQQ
jgi:hypothetical protein